MYIYIIYKFLYKFASAFSATTVISRLKIKINSNLIL